MQYKEPTAVTRDAEDCLESFPRSLDEICLAGTITNVSDSTNELLLAAITFINVKINLAVSLVV